LGARLTVVAAGPSPGRPVAARHVHRGDLSARVHQSVDMARRAVDAAAAPASPPGLAPRDAHCPAPLQPAKVVGESAMLLRVVDFLGVGDAGLHAALDALAARIAPLARGEAVVARLCRPGGGAIEHASAHVFLADLGHRDEAFEGLLTLLMADMPAAGPERPPNHELESHWLAQVRSGEVHHGPADPSLLNRTCLAWPLDVLGCSTLDLYVFTHVVMYATDMGRRRSPLPRPVREISAEAEAALAAALDADNFDLAAELLWTWPMLGLPWPAAASFAFEVLAQAQDEHGFLPGPEYARWRSVAPAGVNLDEIVLRTSYHATLVMGMLCGAALAPGGARRAGARRPSRDAGTVDDLLARLPPRAATPRWQRVLAALPASRRAGLAPLVIDVWLRRAAAAGDLSQVREALAAGLACGEAERPSMWQALALLRRSMAIARQSVSATATPAGSAACRRTASSA